MNVKLLPIVLLLASSPLVAETEFEAYQRQQQQAASTHQEKIDQEFVQYKQELAAGFQDYKKTYQIERKKYRQKITKQWGSYKESNKKTWVNYAQNGRVRETVNFATGLVEVEILANKTESMAKIKQQAKQSIVTLLATTEKQAFENDVVAQKVEEKLTQHTQVVKTGQPSDKTRVLAPLISKATIYDKRALEQLANSFVMSAQTESKPVKTETNKKVVKLSFKIPKNLSPKASLYSARILEIANKEQIPVSLVYAVMETESNFNPLAKSPIPAYGLMQIVPVSAGKDATQYLFGKAKVLSPSYLYNGNNNIEIGGAYLHILYHRYLKKIDDSTSRLFCTIAAYNTGAGNVAKSFIGSYNINKAAKKINTLSPVEVYRNLRKHLPHDETKDYIKRVAMRLAKYQTK